eukprot:TRINITY_DN1852_c0_g1_i2.p1 TRINITY_DN1852_c0_g1~~TRINITY_DN1852_c0_g1_i2.p1  ORF type:complete len:480 (-),score=84.33 TRINITY_DN1852_c0_g1_i2:19-1371(-)
MNATRHLLCRSRATHLRSRLLPAPTSTSTSTSSSTRTFHQSFSSSTPSDESRVYVVGVGMTNFSKPGSDVNGDYPDMAKDAGTQALRDAKNLSFGEVEQAYAGYVYGDSTCGQRAVYTLGETGIPVINVNNNCATGSTALYLAAQAVRGGQAQCTLALGFEKMKKGSLDLTGSGDRVNPLDRHYQRMADVKGGDCASFGAPPAPWLFGAAGEEHMQKYGTTPSQFAKVAVKNHRHSAANTRAQFRDVYTLDQILAAKPIYGPLTMLQCSPTSNGAAAAIVASETFVRDHKLEDQAVEIVSMTMRTDFPSSFNGSAMAVVGADMARAAAEAAFEKAKMTPGDVDVIELHDCFSTNELLTYEALGLCEPGKGGALIDSGAVTYGGRWVVNPSGGLISKGHPLGATGIAQAAELCWQLRGLVGKERQVEGAKVGMQHNLGLGGACVVGIYRRM